MPSKALIIKQLSRFPYEGPYDQLRFHAGVNVLVGPPNTGKTQWLRMLDYLWGDPDPPAEAFSPELAQKYDTLQAVVEIDGQEAVIERRWKEARGRGKVYFNDQAITADEFSAFLMEKLDMPRIHFPKGSPYAAHKWPSLTWRILMRHIYRRQRSWEDIASRQPEPEQHACLLYFLGIAEHLYSSAYGDLVAKNKEIAALEIAKEQFLKLLNRISGELIDTEVLGGNVTTEALREARARLTTEAAALEGRRQMVLNELQEAIRESEASQTPFLESLNQRWSDLQEDQRQLANEALEARARLEEVQTYQRNVSAEMERLQRAVVAGQVFADLKVSHCPACDRPVKRSDAPPDQCFVCKQPYDGEVDEGAGRKRVEFELEQLRAESSEAVELVSMAHDDVNAITRRQRVITEALATLENELRPFRTRAAAILPPEVASINNRLGQIQERIRQLDRIQEALGLRQEYTRDIQRFENERTQLQLEIDRAEALVDYGEAAGDLANGMNMYLRSVQRQNPGAWTQGQIHVKLTERRFEFLVGDKDWRALGGTMQLFFLMAYNFALLRLTHKNGYRYPGLAVLDMLAKFEDSRPLAETENFVVEPFIHMLRQPGIQPSQLIVTGRAFINLQGAHRIELDHVWR